MKVFLWLLNGIHLFLLVATSRRFPRLPFLSLSALILYRAQPCPAVRPFEGQGHCLLTRRKEYVNVIYSPWIAFFSRPRLFLCYTRSWIHIIISYLSISLHEMPQIVGSNFGTWTFVGLQERCPPPCVPFPLSSMYACQSVSYTYTPSCSPLFDVFHRNPPNSHSRVELQLP